MNVSFPQSIRIAETVLLDTAGESLFRWSIPREENYCQFSLVVRNLSGITASFSFLESDGDPASDLIAKIGIPQTGGQIPLPGIVLTGCTLVGGSTSVVVGGATTTADLTIGMPVTGVGIPDFTSVASITDSTHFVMSQGATAPVTDGVINAGGYASPDAVIVGFVHDTSYDQFEKTFTEIAGATGFVMSSGSQKTIYFTTQKHYVSLRCDSANSAIIKIVGNSTANVTPYAKRNARGAI